ncbi:MAG: protoheme farnesyltransferase [Bacteroidota bacterium]|jgi:protoheme IX farnesyltransferase
MGIKAVLELFKLRLSFLVVVSCILSYKMGAEIWIWKEVFWLVLAGFLLAGGSNAANQVLERNWDALMNRTMNRPLPTNRLTPAQGWLIAFASSGAGIFILFYFLNFASGILGVGAFVSYVFVYTPLKRISPWAVFVGAFPGAIPPMIGYVAASNHFGLEAGLLFAVQFMWQFPHFWAIAWVSHEDYTRGGYRLLPFNDLPDKRVAFQILIYTMFLIPVSLLPWALPLSSPMVGNWAAGICILSGLYFVWLSWKLYLDPSMGNARRVMFASFFYLPMIQIAYVIDQL